MNFVNPFYAAHLYDELYFEPEGDLYSDGDIDIFNMSFDDTGMLVPSFDIAIHGVELAFNITFKPDTIECPHCGGGATEVDGVEIDPCMGKLLPGVRNACCGHGDPSKAYIQWDELADDQSGAIYFPRYKATYGIVALSLIYHLAGR